MGQLTCPVFTLTPGPGTLQVQITPVSGETVADYNVQVFSDAQGTTQVASAVITGTTANLNVSAGSRWVRVTPSDNVHPDPVCSLQAVTIPAALPKLATPQNVQVINLGSQLLYDFDDVTGATQYAWEIATDNAFTNIVANSTNTTSDALASGLTPGSTFCFRCKAQASGKADSDWSATVTYGGTKLTTPVITFSNITSSSFKANWPVDANANRMYIEVANNSGFGSPLATAGPGGNSGSQPFSGFSSGQTLYVRVKQLSNPAWFTDSDYGVAQITLP